MHPTSQYHLGERRFSNKGVSRGCGLAARQHPGSRPWGALLPGERPPPPRPESAEFPRASCASGKRHPHALGRCCSSSVPHPSRPCLSFPRSQPVECAAPGWADAATPGTTCRTQDSAGGRRPWRHVPRGELEPCFLARAAPPQSRPQLHLSFGSCASPSRAAASPRPPSSLLPQRPFRLRRTAGRLRPPTSTAYWIVEPLAGAWRRCSLDIPAIPLASWLSIGQKRG